MEATTPARLRNSSTVVLFGERHCGTNLMQQLLMTLFDVRIEPLAYGFKHWWLDHERDRRKQLLGLAQAQPSAAPSVLFLVRGPIPWLEAMYKEPHHHPKPPNMSFQQFLTRSWRSYEQAHPFRYPPQGAVVESAADIFSLREEKLAQMLHMGLRLPRKAFIQYEELLGAPQATLSEIVRKLQLKWRDELASESARVHALWKVLSRKYDPNGRAKAGMRPRSMSSTELNGGTWQRSLLVRKLVCTRLNVSVEREVGYLKAMVRICDSYVAAADPSLRARLSARNSGNELLHTLGPCSWVRPMALTPSQPESMCADYLHLPMSAPSATCERGERVPRIYHAVGEKKVVPPEVTMNAASSLKGFEVNYHDDESAAAFVREQCGHEVGQAYACFVAPAYRADVFRFCALFSQGPPPTTTTTAQLHSRECGYPRLPPRPLPKMVGGVYIDTDIVMLVPITRVVSLCDGASLGHDIPMDRGRLPGKQMKVLAGVKGHPLYRCMLGRIIEHAQARYIPTSQAHLLNITGPSLLQACYEATQLDAAQGGVLITHRDSRNANYPLSGLVGPSGLVAFEQPKQRDYPLDIRQTEPRNTWARQDMSTPDRDEKHYSELWRANMVYSDQCELGRSANRTMPRAAFVKKSARIVSNLNEALQLQAAAATTTMRGGVMRGKGGRNLPGPRSALDA